MDERFCSCCGTTEKVENHHLYPKSMGCPDSLMVDLCFVCHKAAHGVHLDISVSNLSKIGLAKAKARGVKLGWSNPKRRGELAVAVAEDVR